MDKLGSELPELIGGKYRPVRHLGQGGMSTVYVVEHVRTGEQLALKIITFESTYGHEAIERFKREARASARIRSDHVVRVIDADVAQELGGAPYLVMDLLEGQNLEDASGQSPQLPGTVVHWLRQVARALDKAHALGIIHRDLKPENLFLSRRDDGSSMIKILDFGIAKMTAESTGTTQSGQLLGTPLYMSPEQARGDGTAVSGASDLYALGLIAFRLLTGESYWTASTVTGLIAQIVYEPMGPPTDRYPWLGAAFDAWFARACHRDPKQRFSSARELVDQLALTLRISFAAVSSEDAPSAAVTEEPEPAGDETPALGMGAVTLARGSDEAPRSPSPSSPSASGAKRPASGPRGALGSNGSAKSAIIAPLPNTAPELPTLNRAASTLTPTPTVRRRPRGKQIAAVAGMAVLMAVIFAWRAQERSDAPTAVQANGVAAVPTTAAVVPAAALSVAPEPAAALHLEASPAAETAESAAASASPPLTPPRADGLRKPHPSNVAADHRPATATPTSHGAAPPPTGAAHKPAPYDPLSDQK